MNERYKPFANLGEPPVFTTKPKTTRPVEEETIARIAEENSFPSRQPAKTAKAPARKLRRHRTGRNVQFNAKATQETIARIYKQADELGVVMGEWMRLAADAIDKNHELKKSSKPGD
jgi:hypothetical protein